MKSKVEVMDIEPTWTSIINAMKTGHIDVTTSWDSLFQMAKICDVVRQAQKKNVILATFPDGSAVEVTLDEWQEFMEKMNEGKA